MQVETVTNIVTAMQSGSNPIEDPTSDGGVFVDDETLAFVADIETVAGIGFDGSNREAVRILLVVMRRANDRGEDVLEAGRDWLNGWLETTQ